LAQMLLRTTTLPFLHATWTAIAGYFVALAVIDKRRRVALCVLGISVSAVLHGCYDFTVNGDSMVSLFIAAFVYLLFISYIERSQDMVKELEKRKAVAEAVMRGGPVPLPNPVTQTAGESLMIVGDRMTTEV
jgi:RsiW-degrading membrane proteinase PrsW (M82 family)